MISNIYLRSLLLEMFSLCVKDSGLSIIRARIIRFADYPRANVGCSWVKNKVEKKVIQHQMMEKNPQCQQKSQTVVRTQQATNLKIRMCYVYNK